MVAIKCVLILFKTVCSIFLGGGGLCQINKDIVLRVQVRLQKYCQDFPVWNPLAVFGTLWGFQLQFSLVFALHSIINSYFCLSSEFYYKFEHLIDNLQSFIIVCSNSNIIQGGYLQLQTGAQGVNPPSVYGHASNYQEFFLLLP